MLPLITAAENSAAMEVSTFHWHTTISFFLFFDFPIILCTCTVGS